MSRLVQLIAGLLLPALAASLVLPTTTPSADGSCSLIKDIARLKNISSLVIDGQPITNGTPAGGPGMCNGKCCTPDMETTLLATVAQDLHSLLYHSFHSVHGMLASTQASLADKVRQSSKESENMTLSIFAEVYKGMWNEVQTPVADLYRLLSAYLDRGKRIPTDLPPAVPTEDATLLQGYVTDFFKKLFPLVYQETVHSLSNNRSAVTDEYAACLSKSVAEIRPFGSYPEALASKVAKSFETTKVILEALSLGIEVLNVMSSMPENTDSCREALLRLYYCPKCLGLPANVKPCNGYCLNVMRGCLTQQRTTELDLPWSNFLVEVEKLVQQVGDSTEKIPSIDTVLYSFSGTVSDAIMYAAMNGPQLEKQVKGLCGAPKLTLRTTPEPPPAVLTVRKKPAGDDGPVAAQLRQFGQAVETTKARGFFANLAEAMCSDDSFAETRDTADCWNGHRIGEYTKPLVRPGLDAQKYNPELKWTETSADPNIRHLSDKLRHMRQVLLSHFHQEVPLLVSFSQTMGSGSGESWKSGHWDDTDDSDGREEGSGSGDGRIEGDVSNREDEETSVRRADTATVPRGKSPNDKSTGSAFSIRPSVSIVVIFLSFRWII